MKRLLFALIAVFGLTLAMGSSAFAQTIDFYLNTAESGGPASPPAGTIEAIIDLTSPTTAIVTFENVSGNSSYQISNVFLNVNGTVKIGSCGTGTTTDCGAVTGTGLTGAGYNTFLNTSSNNYDWGPFNNEVETNGGNATSISFTLTDTSGTWTSPSNVITLTSGGVDASVDLVKQSGTQRAGEYTVPEPGTLTLLGTGLLGIAGLLRRKLFA